MKKDRDFTMVKEISGKEFRDTGLLWYINQQLHLFGMALSWNPETDEIKPVLCKFRGFDEVTNDEGYSKLSKYIKDNIGEIIKDLDDYDEMIKNEE